MTSMPSLFHRPLVRAIRQVVVVIPMPTSLSTHLNRVNPTHLMLSIRLSQLIQLLLKLTLPMDILRNQLEGICLLSLLPTRLHQERLPTSKAAPALGGRTRM